MISATLATWFNYATTLVFQILFAARFGTSPEAGGFVIAFTVAVSVAGIFITTATTLVMPRLATRDGALSKTPLRALGVGAAAVVAMAVVVAVIGLFAAHPTGTALRLPTSDAQAVLILAAGLVAVFGLSGMVGTVALARGRRAIPAGAHALPSSTAAAYLALTPAPTVDALFVALFIGAIIQLLVVSIVAWLPWPRTAAGADFKIGSQAMQMMAALVALSLVPPVQRVFAGSIDTAGVARFDYAARSIQAAQQLIIGGMLVALLPDWSRLSHDTARLRSNVGATVMIASIGLAAAGAIALVAAPELTQLVFERGAFTGDDTRSVALLVRLMAIGFIAESITLVLVQALFASQRADLAIRLGLGRVAAQVLLTVALGIAFGAPGVAAAYTVTMVLLTVATLGASFGTVAKLPSSWAGYVSAVLGITSAGIVGMVAAGATGAAVGVGLVMLVSLACSVWLKVPELVSMLRRQAAAEA